MLSYLASGNSIENSGLATGLGSILGFVFLGLMGMWLLSALAMRVERQIMPSLPILIIAGVFGLLVMGMLKHFGLM